MMILYINGILEKQINIYSILKDNAALIKE